MAGREKDIDDILNEDAGASASDSAPEEKAAKPKSSRRTSKTAPAETAETPPPPMAPMADEPSEPSPAPKKRRSAWRLILGLVLLGAAAYAGWQAPKWLGQTDQVAALNTSLEAVTAENAQLEAAIADLQRRLAALESRPTGAGAEELAALAQSVEGTAPRIDAVEATIEKLGQRLTALERAAATGADGAVPDAALAGLQSQLDQLKAETSDRLAALEAEVQTLAEAPAQPDPGEMTGRDTLAEIGAALETGAPFSTALMIYTETSGPSDTVEALARHSNGVATLGALQASFPDAARAALDASRADGDAAEAGGFTAFVKGQLGMRSLTPQEGSDADAVLSRAEAALASGDLDTALREIASLSQPARDAMSEWIARAEARQQALSAYATLANSGG